MIPTVERLMSKKIFSIPSGRSVREAAEQMAGHAIGSLLVSRDGGFVGILTEVDIVRKVVAEGLDPNLIPVAQVMTSPLITIEADRSVIGANDLMERKKIRHLAVTQRGEIIGVISVRDFLHPLYLEQEATGF